MFGAKTTSKQSSMNQETSMKEESSSMKEESSMKTNDSSTENLETKNIVNGTDTSSTEDKKQAVTAPNMNELMKELVMRISQAKEEQKTTEPMQSREYLPPAVEVPKVGSNYQMISWSTPQANQYTLANIRYDGPIAIPPGYDQLGAPFPVQDTPEVAQDKAARLAALLRAGGDIYPATKDDIESRNYQRVSWSTPQNVEYSKPAAIPSRYNQIGATSPLFGTINRISQTNAVFPSVSTGSYQGSSWSTPQTSQLNIRYDGPIAIPPGYDEYGAPFPVQDTPEVAQAKAIRLAALAKAGGDIYPAIHQAYLDLDNGAGAFWSDKADGSSTMSQVNGKSKSTAPAINQDQAKSAPVGVSGNLNQAVNDSSVISNVYQERASWQSTKANQIASAYNKYTGPIAIPPGYDESGAPLPVSDTPDVAQVKAIYNDIYAKTLANLVANGLYDQEAEEYSKW